MLNKKNILVFCFIIVGLIFLASGCSKAPDDEIADAGAAVQAAKDAEADKWAPDEFKSAEDLLAQAKSQVEEKEYKEAKKLAIDAKEKAEEATEKALAAKAEAENMASDRAARLASEKAAEEERLRKLAEASAMKLPMSHTVSKGDCLWCIAGQENVYNDPYMWPLIYNANKDKIKNADLIYPNQNFEIPRNGLSLDDIKEARKSAGAIRPYTPPAQANIPE